MSKSITIPQIGADPLIVVIDGNNPQKFQAGETYTVTDDVAEIINNLIASFPKEAVPTEAVVVAPIPTVADAGKVLSVSESGEYTLVEFQKKTDESWHQCPELVQNYVDYIKEHPYSSDDYTTSVVMDYAPTPADLSNTKPIGAEVDDITYYNTVPNADTPFASEHTAGTLNPLDQVRWINSSTNNFRDIGGWECDGGTVKYGLIYRSGELKAQDENLVVNELGIKTEIDLTADGTPAYGTKLRFVGHTSYAMYTLANPDAWRVNLRGVFDAVLYGDPVVFHCSMGADRTGTLACILEGLLGVSQSDIDADYELTSFYYERTRSGNYQGGVSDWKHLIAEIQALSGSTFRDKCVTFVLSLGFSASDINAFRKAMIDGTPETLTPTVDTVSISTTLSNITIDNTASSMDKYRPYNAVLTPSTGYVLDSVDITMGGNSVKDSVYTEEVFPLNKGKIAIPSATGSLAITASAVKGISMLELFDYTQATLNVRFSSSGSTSASNGHFVTAFIEIPSAVRMNTTEAWRIYIKDTTDPTKFQGTQLNESVLYCKSDQSLISANYGRLGITQTSPAATTLLKVEDQSGGIYIDINKTSDGNFIPSNYFDVADVAYIRVCLKFSSSAIASADALANVSIMAEKIVG